MRNQGISTIKILVILGIIFLCLLSLFLLLKSSPGARPAWPNSDKLSVQGKKSVVEAENFLKNPLEEIGDSAVVAKTQGYHIIYYKTDQAFSITLLSQPPARARELAEKAFLEKLNIHIGQACDLKVSTYVPFFVDGSLSGKDYGLSFCPEGVQF